MDVAQEALLLSTPVDNEGVLCLQAGYQDTSEEESTAGSHVPQPGEPWDYTQREAVISLPRSVPQCDPS